MRSVWKVFLLLLLAALNSPAVYGENGGISVKKTGELIFTSAPGFANDSDTPAGMTAARLSKNDTIIRWKPSKDTVAISGKADLMDALISADESLLVIVERVGGADKLNLSRFILVNLYNGKICSAFDLPQRIVKIYPIPGRSTQLLAIRRSQKELAQTDKLLIIDLALKKVVKSSGDFPAPVKSAVTDGRRLWFALEGRKYFSEVELEKLDGKAAVTDAKNIVNVLQLSRNGKVLQVLEKGVCEFYDITDDGAMLAGSVALPGDISPDYGIACGGVQDLFLAVRRGDGLLLAGGSLNKIEDRAEGQGVYLHNENMLFVCSAIKNRIRRFKLPECDEERALEPGALKPSVNNRTFRLFQRSGKPFQLV